MKSTTSATPAPKNALSIKRLTIRTGVTAGQELTIRCSMHHDCGTGA